MENETLENIASDLEEALGEWIGVDEVYCPERLVPVKRAYDKVQELLTQ
ncbi:hypothetical protein [Tellurirhabdus bombi]|nr:hypothetical protein [Tellurirhabdus bombi]